MRYVVGMKLFFLSVIPTFLLLGCGSAISDSEHLNRAILFADSSAVKVLYELSQIKNRNGLNEKESIRYHLLDAEAHLILGKEYTNDTILETIASYYNTQKDTVMYYKTLFLTAIVKYRQQKYEKSLLILDESKPLLSFFEEKNMLISNSNLYIRNFLSLNRIEDAKSVGNKLLKELESSGEPRDIVSGFFSLARVSKHTQNISEAKDYYQKALEIAKANEYIDIQEYILNQLIALVSEKKQYKKALFYAKQLDSIRSNRIDIPQRNFIKSILYSRQNKQDSALYYMKIASEGNDAFVASLANSYISSWQEEMNDYLSAFYKFQLATELVRGIEMGVGTASLVEEYEKEKLKNENNELRIEQQENENILLTILVLLLVLFTVGIFIWVKYRQKLERVRLQNEMERTRQENLLLRQSQEISVLREKESNLRESLVRKISFIENIPSLSQNKEKSKSQRKIRMSDTDWDELIRSIEEIYPGFLLKLAAYKSLTKDDIHFCCLLKINVSMEDLSNIYCVSKSTITKKKYRLKIYKFNFFNKEVDLNTFICDL